MTGTVTIDPKALRQLERRLERAFGAMNWWPARSVFEMMVGAILTQNTNWANVEKAIANLRRAKALAPQRIDRMRASRLEALIRPAGYYSVKAGRLAALCRWYLDRCGGRPSRLSAIDTDTLRDELLSVHGVGPETADSILLYGFERPVFVIDAYTRRVLARHRIASGTEPYEDLRTAFENALKGSDRVCRYNECHARIVELAKRHCRARPTCEACPMASWRDFPPAGLKQ